MKNLLDGPVGLRWRTQNVTNSVDGQKTVIELLSKIPVSDGGKLEKWLSLPLPGPKHNCPKFLADAIFEFQSVWKRQGGNNTVDGVVDPEGRTIKHMLRLASGGHPLDPLPPDPPQNRTVIFIPTRTPGTWQITGMWSVTLGEVGQVGMVEMEITQPDNRKFLVKGIGAGVGLSVDPVSWLKALSKGAKALGPGFEAARSLAIKAIAEMLGKGIAFNLGDYLQKIASALGTPVPSTWSVTGGRIIANPINGALGRPTVMSRYLITEGDKSNFYIVSAGGGIGAGMEGGAVFMGYGGLGLLCGSMGIYGSSGVTIKVGAGVQGMYYAIRSVENVP